MNNVERFLHKLARLVEGLPVVTLAELEPPFSESASYEIDMMVLRFGPGNVLALRWLRGSLRDGRENHLETHTKQFIFSECMVSE